MHRYSIIRYNYLDGGNRQIDFEFDGATLTIRVLDKPLYTVISLLRMSGVSGMVEIIRWGGEFSNQLFIAKVICIYHNNVVYLRNGDSTLSIRLAKRN